MSTTRHGLYDGAALQRRRLRLAVSCFLMISTFLVQRGAEAQADHPVDRVDPAVARTMLAFYKAWTGRDLADGKGMALVREHIAYHRKQGHDAAGVREETKSFATVTAQLRKHDGTPVGLRLRHDLLTGNFFAPDMQNTRELELLNQPDPVRFYDDSTRRVMTQKDVVALANLILFAHSDGAPSHRDLSLEEAEAFVEKRLCDLSKCGVSEFFSEAAIVWAGIQQHWARFTAEERRQARSYVQEGRVSIMTVALGVKVLGLDKNVAFRRITKGINDDFWQFQKTMILGSRAQEIIINQ